MLCWEVACVTIGFFLHAWVVIVLCPKLIIKIKLVKTMSCGWNWLYTLISLWLLQLLTQTEMGKIWLCFLPITVYHWTSVHAPDPPVHYTLDEFGLHLSSSAPNLSILCIYYIILYSHDWFLSCILYGAYFTNIAWFSKDFIIIKSPHNFWTTDQTWSNLAPKFKSSLNTLYGLYVCNKVLAKEQQESVT